MKLADVAKFLDDCLVAKIPVPLMKVEIEDFYQEVPEEHHKTRDLEYSRHDGHNVAKVIIIPATDVAGVYFDENLIDSRVMKIVVDARIKQLEKGYDAEQDDEYADDVLATAGGTYAMRPTFNSVNYDENGKPFIYPFDVEYWKPSPDNRLKELGKACALIMAEMAKILRKQ